MADANLRIKISTTGSSEVSSSIKSIASAASSLKAGLISVGAAAAGIAGLGALGAAAIGVAKLGGELSDLSARTGISTKSLIILRQAFQDAGVGADSVGKFVNLLQKNLVDAAENGGSAADSLSKLGLSAGELIRLNPGEQFSKVSEAISNISDPTQRASVAMSIFGKSAGELLPLFADGGALQNAERVLGKMPDVLARNVPILDNISDAFDRLPNKATQLFAGVFDQIAPTVQAILDAFESIDLTAAGQRIGAFLMVAVDQFRQGRFGEFVGLTIEAGFEQGIKASKSILDFFLTQDVANGIGNMITSVLAGIAKAFIQIDSFFTGYWNALFIYVGTAFYNVLAKVLNDFAAKVESVITGALALAKLLSPVGSILPNKVNLGRATPAEGSFDSALASGMEMANKRADILSAGVDVLLSKYRELFGIESASTNEIEKQGTATERLNRLIASMMAARDAATKNADEAKKNDEVNKTLTTKEALQYLELDLKRKIQVIDQEKGKIEASWLMTSSEKYTEKKKLLEEELKLIEQQIAALQIVRETADAATQAQIDAKIVGLQGQGVGIQQGIYGMGADPQSYTQQFAAAFTSLREQAQITAATLAQTFADVFNSAIQSISNGITGLIMGTLTWAQALRNIATSILTSIVSAIVSMGVRWIATQILMATVGKSIMAAAVAASAPIAAAQAAVWASPATLATIASYGAAAAAAPGFIAASQGIVMAQSMAMFKEGGYTGDGDPNSVAGIVHRGEYVMPADAVDRIGISTLEAMRGGVTAAGTSGTTTGPSPITLNMGVFDDPRRMADWARSSDGRTVIVDIVRQHAHEFSRA